jgi:hypothetical protein
MHVWHVVHPSIPHLHVKWDLQENSKVLEPRAFDKPARPAGQYGIQIAVLTNSCKQCFYRCKFVPSLDTKTVDD